jgi:hypothetical protein
MKSRNALKEFEAYLRRDGDSIPKTAFAGFARMLEFYRDVRVDDVSLEADGDMLLFQWGTCDWGRGPHFEIDLTRQLIRGEGEDDDIWQLHLTYRFAVSDALRDLEDGNRWCSLPDELAAFEAFVTGHPALKATGAREDGQAEIDYYCAG